MTSVSGAIGILALVVFAAVAFILVWKYLAGRENPKRRELLMEQARQVAEAAVVRAAENAQDAAVRAYQQQQQALYEEQAAKRKDAAARAKDTKAQRIAALLPWRETFVTFVRRLGEPFFGEWALDTHLLEQWAEERADVYIAKKPYVLEIIQAIHADAQRAAESYANQTGKSTREIARERAKAASRNLVRNAECPYCNRVLDDDAHLDHIHPVQRGGPSEPWNMVFACARCNRAKRDLSLREFADTEYAKRNGLSIVEITRRLNDLGKNVEMFR